MNTQERNKQVKDYIEAALALFSLESEISEDVINEMLFHYCNQQTGVFESLFHELDELDIKDSKMVIDLHESLINWLNNMGFKSIEAGISQYKKWIELRNEDYEEQKIEEANEHYLSVNDRV